MNILQTREYDVYIIIAGIIAWILINIMLKRLRADEEAVQVHEGGVSQLVTQTVSIRGIRVLRPLGVPQVQRQTEDGVSTDE